MKRQLIAMLAAGAFVVSSASAEIVLTEDLSLYGYLDMATGDNDVSGDNSATAVAEFELGFDYTTEPFFATVELSFAGTMKDSEGSDSDVDLETAIVGWNVNENLVLSAGNILSYLGWETYDATGLYQFSYAYRDFTPLYPAYAAGIAADYATDDYSIGVWLGDADEDELSYEIAGKFTGIEGFTLFGAWADDPGYETINFWASYEVNGFTFALEYVDVDNEGAVADQEGYLAMVNYAYEDYGFTFRYSVEETEGIDEDWELFTFSPSYTFSDNFLGLAELSFIEDGGDVDYAWAVELIYTF